MGGGAQGGTGGGVGAGGSPSRPPLAGGRLMATGSRIFRSCTSRNRSKSFICSRNASHNRSTRGLKDFRLTPREGEGQAAQNQPPPRARRADHPPAPPLPPPRPDAQQLP